MSKRLYWKKSWRAGEFDVKSWKYAKVDNKQLVENFKLQIRFFNVEGDKKFQKKALKQFPKELREYINFESTDEFKNIPYDIWMKLIKCGFKQDWFWNDEKGFDCVLEVYAKDKNGIYGITGSSETIPHEESFGISWEEETHYVWKGVKKCL